MSNIASVLVPLRGVKGNESRYLEEKVLLSSDRVPASAIEALEGFGYRVEKLENVSSATNVDFYVGYAVEPIEEVRRRISRFLGVSPAPVYRLQDALRERLGVKLFNAYMTPITFGPENFFGWRRVIEMPSALRGLNSSKPTLDDALKLMGVENAWSETDGDGAVSCIFDTSFCSDFFGKRVMATFHGDDVDSAFSNPEEGHGTMVAVSMSGSREDGAPFDGVAPGSKQILCRITDRGGRIVYVPEAWDWLVGYVVDEGLKDVPIVTNHSYGYVLCHGPNLYYSVETFMVKAILRAFRNISACYAAGNSAMRCGHRLSGLTNSITGPSSVEEAYCIGALRFDLREAQPYSSHGFGQEHMLSPIGSSTPYMMKPDFSNPIPSVLPYGCDVKDMSMALGNSAGGTSEASPLFAGILVLVKSIVGASCDFKVRNALYKVARKPRPTHVNLLLGCDARFGRGYVKADEAVAKCKEMLL